MRCFWIVVWLFGLLVCLGRVLLVVFLLPLSSAYNITVSVQYKICVLVLLYYHHSIETILKQSRIVSSVVVKYVKVNRSGK